MNLLLTKQLFWPILQTSKLKYERPWNNEIKISLKVWLRMGKDKIICSIDINEMKKKNGLETEKV